MAVVRRVLTRQWAGRLALLAGAVAAFVELGRWQWSRGLSQGGSARNILYGVQWWCFAAFAVFWCVRLLLRDGRGVSAEPRRPRASAVDPAYEAWVTNAGRPGAAPGPAGVDGAGAAGAGADAAGAGADDEELAAYNRMLAELDARSRS